MRPGRVLAGSRLGPGTSQDGCGMGGGCAEGVAKAVVGWPQDGLVSLGAWMAHECVCGFGRRWCGALGVVMFVGRGLGSRIGVVWGPKRVDRCRSCGARLGKENRKREGAANG